MKSVIPRRWLHQPRPWCTNTMVGVQTEFHSSYRCSTVLGFLCGCLGGEAEMGRALGSLPCHSPKSVSSRSSERPCLKNKVGEKYLMSTPGLHTCMHACTHAHIHTHTHAHIHTQVSKITFNSSFLAVRGVLVSGSSEDT